jgi:hypothetical protein
MMSGAELAIAGHPVSGESEIIGQPRKIERITQSLRGGGAGGDRREVEDGERDHESDGSH